IADSFLHTFAQIRNERVNVNKETTDDDAGGGESNGGLLDLCFSLGLLPSYAFPTDLCSFVIHEWDKSSPRWRINVKERPQLAKAQALSEYAPGRLLVVNKQTYRVGGIFVDGPLSSSPAAALFARPLSRYIGCSRCSYVS